MEYDVEEFFLGDKQTPDKIIFTNKEDLEQAYKDIDNGKDICIVKDGIMTKILFKTISQKVYEGTIQLGARIRKEGE